MLRKKCRILPIAAIILMSSACFYHEGDDVYIEEADADLIVEDFVYELSFEDNSASSDAFFGPDYVNTNGDIEIISDALFTSVIYTGYDRFGQELRVEVENDALQYGEIFEEGLAFADLDGLTFFADVTFINDFGDGMSLAMDELEIYVDPFDRGRSLLTIQLFGLGCQCDAYDEVYIEAVVDPSHVVEYVYD